MNCSHCQEPITGHISCGSAYHTTLCCDCFDLSCGMPLEKLNEERKAKGLKPIEREWGK